MTTTNLIRHYKGREYIRFIAKDWRNPIPVDPGVKAVAMALPRKREGQLGAAMHEDREGDREPAQ